MWVWYATGIMNVTNEQMKMVASSEKKLRVGILTFHSQINYGGVLQAFALQEVLLQKAGVHVKVVDYWLATKNAMLVGLFVPPFGRAIILLLTGVLSLCGRVMDSVRRIRTWRFIHKRLALTDYHLETWEDLKG